MRKFFWIFIVFILAFAVRVYNINLKNGLHVDEALSYVISSGNNYGWTENFDINTEYNGEEILKLTLGNPQGIIDSAKDIASIYPIEKTLQNEDNLKRLDCSIYFKCFEIGY